jgi:hypothetical protein
MNRDIMRIAVTGGCFFFMILAFSFSIASWHHRIAPWRWFRRTKREEYTARGWRLRQYAIVCMILNIICILMWGTLQTPP